MAKIKTLDGVTHDVEVGDKVRLTQITGDTAEFTVTRVGYEAIESNYNYFGGAYNQSLEILERDVKLPSNEGAVVGHPTSSGWVSYQLNSRGEWWAVDISSQGSTRKTSSATVIRAMVGDLGFKVLYEGRG